MTPVRIVIVGTFLIGIILGVVGFVQCDTTPFIIVNFVLGFVVGFNIPRVWNLR